jgi:hypothetical protein
LERAFLTLTTGTDLSIPNLIILTLSGKVQALLQIIKLLKILGHRHFDIASYSKTKLASIPLGLSHTHFFCLAVQSVWNDWPWAQAVAMHTERSSCLPACPLDGVSRTVNW